VERDARRDHASTVAVEEKRAVGQHPTETATLPAGHPAMAEHTRLSEERLKLIRSFIGGPAGESEEPSDPRVPVQPLDSGAATARPRPSPAPPRVSPARQSSSSHQTRARSQRKPNTGPGPFLRHHFRLRWPIAAIFLGVIIGVLVARVA
jgi:hypothetical protein